MTEEQIFDFIQENIKSVWAIELLLVLARDRNRVWGEDELVREMRGSAIALQEAVRNLRLVALARQEPDGRVRFNSASASVDELTTEIEKVYATKPRAVMNAIFSVPNEKLRMFADAFKLKRE